ncbi:MAG TPA: hypothetical protein VLG67_04580 [Candidatus Saccharimonadales bacterium]|nr:hypothetical protein [Candidatus Saccharimonadales bacterium]
MSEAPRFPRTKKIIRTQRSVLLSLAVSAASLGVCAVGTSRQTDCFEELQRKHGVAEFSQLPKKVVDSSGCLSPLNTGGLLGSEVGLVSAAVLYVRNRRKREFTEIIESNYPNFEN